MKSNSVSKRQQKAIYHVLILQLERLLLLRDFITEITNRLNHRKNVIPVVSPQDWEECVELVNILKLPYVATLRMQKEKYVPADFYGDWINLKLQLEKMPHVVVARNLLKNMIKRENGLINAPCVLASVFIDPKFKILLSDQQAAVAIDHLTKIRSHLKIDGPSGMSTHMDKNESNSLSELSLFIKKQKMVQAPRDSNLPADIFFRSIYNMPHIDDLNLDPIKHWAYLKTNEPELYKIICTVNAAAPTQVSVERVFSGLSFVLSACRTRLSDALLDSILISRLNKSLLQSQRVQIIDD